MPIQAKLIYSDIIQAQEGPLWARDLYACTGLTQNSANTVPFPNPLLRNPRRVILIPAGNAAAGALISLDTSQGIADPTGTLGGGKLGADQNNLYVYIGSGTEFLADVEW